MLLSSECEDSALSSRKIGTRPKPNFTGPHIAELAMARLFSLSFLAIIVFPIILELAGESNHQMYGGDLFFGERFRSPERFQSDFIL